MTKTKSTAEPEQVSAEVETSTAEMSAPVPEKKPTAKAKSAAKPATLVYCGPSARGVAKQYTVFCGGMPKELEEFIGKHPAAKSLIVPVAQFAEMRRKLETAGTVEEITYKKVKSEM